VRSNREAAVLRHAKQLVARAQLRTCGHSIQSSSASMLARIEYVIE
jgi:hypothetical protein